MWRYTNPVAIYAGINSLDRLPALLGQRRAILITFPEAEALGLCPRLRNLLGEQLLTIVSDVQPNPDVAWLAPMYEQLWQASPEAECIIALGGGSAIDCAKAMLYPSPTNTFVELLAHLRGEAPPPAGKPRALIAIPTTAGTGSEVTPWATIWDKERGHKYSLHLPGTFPEAALIDPALMLSLPKAATLASGLDALSHALEAIWNINRNPVSNTLAVSAAQEIICTLPKLMADSRNLALRERIATAALQAGLAFSNTKTALAHSLSYGITLDYGVAHGIACSFSLPHIMQQAFGHDPEVDRHLQAVFCADTTNQAINHLRNFLEGLGVSTDHKTYGISDIQWQNMLAHALTGPRGQNFIGSHAKTTT